MEIIKYLELNDKTYLCAAAETMLRGKFIAPNIRKIKLENTWSQ